MIYLDKHFIEVSTEAGSGVDDYTVPMILFCPNGHRHIDEQDFADKPHHTHACQECGIVWRPAKINTHGVRFLPGYKNEAPPMTQPDKLAVSQEARDAALAWFTRTSEAPALLAQAFQRAMNQAAEVMRERSAKIADPPLMHRKGKVGLWRKRRADIATSIRSLPLEEG